ncbi:MAG: pyridoxamine 5'-phosphate oxidase family protein [Alphaproteobacteria bacterium]|jgi:hypothetical protein|nr:phosphohydrolase [Rhodospirillaceae bacterium]MDP6022905.1 pyridoxamine 5'-phosphate oxidase family protein [Alphaproteobacteria bacterium]MDP6254033.1 pyridoxamine 5'-phosphate oxidase family protein [Alphaproteobacteria bacterium]MDP7055820.1 pyridoxamine 5'-phosphate oxidase family protein [Alphaproteobacteria bacterium]MDP7230517.1 pyridoxamine 5'-phosphate oxidase family protein [Alphaproteobacteria bacterium]|tara:strand:+ start:2940 stop:3551 length:612 start_codon:yes stop_codon:yes gene_type:complete
MAKITTYEELRALYPPTVERAVLKEMSALDRHAKRYIELSPFVALATTGVDGLGDVTPRGGEPGQVRVENDNSVLLPDWPGNNRLDSLENIIDCPGVGLLFLIPGVKETLRVNGKAEIITDDDVRQLFEMRGKLPRSVIRIAVEEVYLHCAKALMRSHLWDDAARIERSELPTMNQMIRDQTGSSGPLIGQEEMEESYKAVLY